MVTSGDAENAMTFTSMSTLQECDTSAVTASQGLSGFMAVAVGANVSAQCNKSFQKE